MVRVLDLPDALPVPSVASPGWKKPCFLKSDYQKHLVKWPLETKTSSQIITFELRVKKTSGFFNDFVKITVFTMKINYFRCSPPDDSQMQPLDAWPSPRPRLRLGLRLRLRLRLRLKSKTTLRLSLLLGLRQRLRLKLRLVSNWNTCLGSSPRIIVRSRLARKCSN